MFQAMFLSALKENRKDSFLKGSLTIFHRELKKKRNKKIFEHWMTIQEGLKNMTTTKRIPWMTGKMRFFLV